MTLSPELSFDAHIAPILAGVHAPGLPSCTLEIQRLLARLDFPTRATRRAASIVASIQDRLSSRLAGNLQRWKDLGEAEKLLYIVMGLEQTNFRFNAFATIHVKQDETAEQVVYDLRGGLRHADPMAEVLAVEALDRRIRYVHCLISIPRDPTTRAGRSQYRQIVAWFDERNGRPGIAWKNGSGVPAHLEWLDEQKVFQRVGVGGLVGAASYMAAQREMRLIAGRGLRAIGKQFHAAARLAVHLPLETPASLSYEPLIHDDADAEKRSLPAFDPAKLARQEWERSWWRVPPLMGAPEIRMVGMPGRGIDATPTPVLHSAQQQRAVVLPVT